MTGKTRSYKRSNGAPLSLLHVAAASRSAYAGLASAAGGGTIRVALGRAGIQASSAKATAARRLEAFRPIRLWWRADRLPRPRTLLPVRRIGPDDAWCEDPSDRRYNRPFRRSANEPGDRLRREDGLYDLIVEIDHNTRPRVARLRQRRLYSCGTPGLCADRGLCGATPERAAAAGVANWPKTRIKIHT